MEVILTVEHLRRHFSAEPVLLDTSFQLRAGDKAGLVRPNGCGKTILLNILADREESEKGTIEKASHITIGYLEQRPAASHRTVIEEAKLALAPLIGDFLLVSSICEGVEGGVVILLGSFYS